MLPVNARVADCTVSRNVYDSSPGSLLFDGLFPTADCISHDSVD